MWAGSRRLIFSDWGLRKRQGVLEGPLDLGEESRRQSSQPLNEAALVYGFDLLGDGLGGKAEASNALGDHRMARGEVGNILDRKSVV